MGSADVCTGAGASKDPTHASLPKALNARAGSTQLLMEGNPPTTYRAGRSYKLSVVPGKLASNSTWFLLDAGNVGTFSSVEGGGGVSSWRTQCHGSRASFESATGGAVTMLWTVPTDAHGTVVLRVAAATSMGSIGINAAILNTTASAPPLPPGVMGYACTSLGSSAHAPWPLRQCQPVPPGTAGALNMSSCEAECLRGNGTFRCTRCAHVYDPKAHGGVAFEDLPDDWKCPVCGAPKDAYAKQIDNDGAVRWMHQDA